jgi:hypothetical protein
MCRAILRHPNVSEATIIAILRRSVSFLESIPELGTSSEAKGVQAEFVETWQEIQDTAQKALQRKRSIG